MCGSVEPIVEKINTQETQIPCPRGIPRKSCESVIIVHIRVSRHFDTEYNKPETRL